MGGDAKFLLRVVASCWLVAVLLLSTGCMESILPVPDRDAISGDAVSDTLAFDLQDGAIDKASPGEMLVDDSGEDGSKKDLSQEDSGSDATETTTQDTADHDSGIVDTLDLVEQDTADADLQSLDLADQTLTLDQSDGSDSKPGDDVDAVDATLDADISGCIDDHKGVPLDQVAAQARTAINKTHKNLVLCPQGDGVVDDWFRIKVPANGWVVIYVDYTPTLNPETRLDLQLFPTLGGVPYPATDSAGNGRNRIALVLTEGFYFLRVGRYTAQKLAQPTLYALTVTQGCSTGAECDDDSSCDTTLHQCFLNSCLSNADCGSHPTNRRCHEGSCVACTTSNHCVDNGHPDGAVCKTGNNTCGCSTADDCKLPSRPLCRKFGPNFRCSMCASDGSCAVLSPYWRHCSAGTCIECTSNFSCTDNPIAVGPTCDNGRCICQSDNDCNGGTTDNTADDNPNGPICDTLRKMCACNASDICGANRSCVELTADPAMRGATVCR